MWSFVAKSAVSVVAALSLISAGAAQSPGGGGQGSGVVLNNGQFKITEVVTGRGTGQFISLFGTTPTAFFAASASAGVDGVEATARGEGTGKRTVTIEWIGSGAPPQYGFVKLSSVANYQKSEGATVEVALGLPLVAPRPEDIIRPMPEIVTIIRGQKIAKLKLDTNGKAVIEIEGGIKVTAAGTQGNGFNAGAQGDWRAEATLDLKALGLAKSTSKREVSIIGTHEGPGYPVPAGGTDYERQEAHVGVSVIEETGYGLPMPVYEVGVIDTLIGISRLGSWTTSCNPSVSVTGVGTANRVDDEQSGICFGVRYVYNSGQSGLQNLWHSPVATEIKAKQTDTGSDNPGPFTGSLKMYIHAPSELLEGVNFTRTSGWTQWAVKQQVGSATVAGRLTFVGQTAVMTADVGQDTTTGFPVEVSGGIEFPIWKELTVNFDISKAIGEEQGFSSTTGLELGIGPCTDPVEKWKMFCRTTTQHRTRYQARYEAGGYTGDFHDTIDNTGPAELEFEVRKVASGLAD
ncbi:MAG: hypothetical protein WCK51_09060 [Armatimonadota bacterium]